MTGELGKHRIDGIEFADDPFADVHDPAVGHMTRVIVRHHDRAGDVEIHGERDGIRLGSRPSNLNNGPIDR